MRNWTSLIRCHTVYLSLPITTGILTCWDLGPYESSENLHQTQRAVIRLHISCGAALPQDRSGEFLPFTKILSKNLNMLWSGVTLWNTILRKWERPYIGGWGCHSNCEEVKPSPSSVCQDSHGALPMTKHPTQFLPFLTATGSGYSGGKWTHPNWNLIYLTMVSPSMLSCIKFPVDLFSMHSLCVLVRMGWMGNVQSCRKCIL